MMRIPSFFAISVGVLVSLILSGCGSHDPLSAASTKLPIVEVAQSREEMQHLDNVRILACFFAVIEKYNGIAGKGPLSLNGLASGVRPELFGYWKDQPSCGILGVTGRGAAFDQEVTRSMESLDDDTIILVESVVRERSRKEQREMDVLGNLEKLLGAPNGISSQHKCGFLVVFKDGVIWRLSKSIPSAELAKFMDVSTAKQFDRHEVLEKWRCPWTYPGVKI